LTCTYGLKGSSEIRTFKPRLLLSGDQGLGQKHVAAAVLDALDGHHVQSFDLAMLMGDSVRVSVTICYGDGRIRFRLIQRA